MRACAFSDPDPLACPCRSVCGSAADRALEWGRADRRRASLGAAGEPLRSSQPGPLARDRDSRSRTPRVLGDPHGRSARVLGQHDQGDRGQHWAEHRSALPRNDAHRPRARLRRNLDHQDQQRRANGVDRAHTRTPASAGWNQRGGRTRRSQSRRRRSLGPAPTASAGVLLGRDRRGLWAPARPGDPGPPSAEDLDRYVFTVWGAGSDDDAGRASSELFFDPVGSQLHASNRG